MESEEIQGITCVEREREEKREHGNGGERKREENSKNTKRLQPKATTPKLLNSSSKVFLF